MYNQFLYTLLTGLKKIENPCTNPMINGYNARCLSHITQKTAYEEASAKTRTYDLVAAIRQRRYKWLGHILRLQGHRYVKEAVRAQMQLNLPGNITMDSPAAANFEELTAFAQDRVEWRKSLKQQDADVSASENQRRLPISLLRSKDNKCTITMKTTTTTALERQSTKAAWEKILKPKDNMNGKDACKRKKKKVGWSDRQRAQWARAHYHIHHGKVSKSEQTPSPIINRNDKMTVWSTVKATQRPSSGGHTTLWDAQAEPPTAFTTIPRCDHNKRTKWKSPIGKIFDSSTESSYESTINTICAHTPSPTKTCALTTPATTTTLTPSPTSANACTTPATTTTTLSTHRHQQMHAPHQQRQQHSPPQQQQHAHKSLQQQQ